MANDAFHRFRLATRAATCAVILVTWTAANASPQLLLSEDFDSYADQSAFASVWAADGEPDAVLDASPGNPGQSLKMPPTEGGGLTNRWYMDLGATYYGSDAEPLVFSYDLYLDPAGAETSWEGAWHSVNIRAYEGGGYKQGRLQQGLSIGVSTHPLPSDSTWFQGRLMEATYSSGPDPLGYFDLNNQSGAPSRSAGWHHLKAVVTTSQIRFWVDGQLADIFNHSLEYGINTVVLGDGQPANGYTMWADNVRVEIVPEPATLMLLTLAVCPLLRRRCR